MIRHLTSLPRGLAFGAAALAVVSFAAGSADAQELMMRAKSDGIVIGYAEEAPFAHHDGAGNLIGIDPEIIRIVFDKMGVKTFKPQLTDWGGLVPGVKAKRWDMAITGIYIKPDRCKNVLFTDPIYVIADGLVTTKGNPYNLHSFEDVAAKPKIKMGTTIGGTGPRDHAYAIGVQRNQIVELPGYPELIAALKADRIQTFTGTDVGNLEVVKKANDPDLHWVPDFKVSIKDGKPLAGITAFAFNHASKAFVDDFNKHLAGLREMPKFIEMLGKHGMPPSAKPTSEMRTANICKG